MRSSQFTLDQTTLLDVIRRVRGKELDVEPSEIERYAEILEAYECWIPLFTLLNGAIEAKTADLNAYVRLAKVQGRWLGDYVQAAEICQKLVAHAKIGLAHFRQQVLSQVAADSDYNAEARILEGVSGRFERLEDNIHCLERLCHLYEKKVPNEEKQASAYEALLAIDPENIKALRYFKLVHAQENEWQEVVAVLRKIIKVAPTRDLYRVSHELAAVLLYQLDDPRSALETLEEHCRNSPLDTSAISYDAHYRLSDWHGCIGVLRNCLARATGGQEEAVLHYKIGSIFELLGEFAKATENYKQSFERNPTFLEPIESLICIYMDKKDWKAVYFWLAELQKRVRLDVNREKIKDALLRLQAQSIGIEALKTQTS